MFKKRLNKYMISYYYYTDNTARQGFGNSIIETGLDFLKSENYNIIIDSIKQQNDFDIVIILNILKLKN
jgi:hypothetical protein